MKPCALPCLLLIGIGLFVSHPAGAESRPKSGVVGQALITFTSCQPLVSCAQPIHATVTVLVYEEGHLIAAVDSDEQGSFQINLKPGDYLLMPYLPPPDPNSPRVGSVQAASTRVTVTKKSFTQTYVLEVYSHF